MFNRKIVQQTYLFFNPQHHKFQCSNSSFAGKAARALDGHNHDQIN